MLASNKHLIPDLSQAMFIDSAVTNALFAARKQASARGRLAVQRGTAAIVELVLDLTGIERILPRVHTRTEAIDTIRQFGEREGKSPMKRQNKLAVAAIASVALAVGAGVVVNEGSAAGAVRPANLDPPQITGTAQTGSTLTATDGRWSGSPTDINLQWRRCDENGGSCSNISGAEGKTYLLKTVDVGNTIRVTATAKNADGTRSSTSVPTAVVKAATTPPPPSGNGCQGAGATVQISGLAPPERLNVDRASSDPAVVGGSTDRVSLRVRISACNGKPVQGALVYVTAVPYNMFSVPPEATTGADGVAELSMNRLRGYPATPRQQLLVFFIRARKQGENLLGGISSRRLVSVPVDLRR